jgi:ankyrin repeat protein
MALMQELDVRVTQSNTGTTALHNVVSWDSSQVEDGLQHLSLVKLIAQKAEISATNSKGETALHLAVLQGNLPIILVLIAAGAECNAVTLYVLLSSIIAQTKPIYTDSLTH